MKMSELRRLKAEVDEVIVLRDNLQAVQARCTELLNAYRTMRYVLEECDRWFSCGTVGRSGAILHDKVKQALSEPNR